MFFRKKEKEEGVGSLRRKFHHSMLTKRRAEGLSRVMMPTRTQRTQTRKPPSPLGIFFKKIGLTVLVATILVGGLYTVFFSSFFVVAKVTLEKTGTAVQAGTLSPFLDKLKGKNLLFVNLESLTREIQQTFQHEILLVKIRKSPPSTLVVQVEEYPAVLNVKVQTDSTTQTFVINQIGYIIAENAPKKDLPTITVNLPKPVEGKAVLITQERLYPIVDAFTKFPALFGMKAAHGTWKKVERELHLVTEKNFEVWIDLTQDIDVQFSKLKRALPKLDIYHEPIEYIDLRIPGGDSEKIIFNRKK